MTVTACSVGLGHRSAQRIVLALILVHGDLLMDPREAMLINVFIMASWNPLEGRKSHPT
jgi:hypothetical protein